METFNVEISLAHCNVHWIYSIAKKNLLSQIVDVYQTGHAIATVNLVSNSTSL